MRYLVFESLIQIVSLKNDIGAIITVEKQSKAGIFEGLLILH